MDDLRKTAVIDIELHRLNIDIAALQETRLPDSGSLQEKHYTFFWQGKAEDETREYGVGFAVRNSLIRMITPPNSGTERILKLQLTTTSGTVNFICAYAPTLYSSSELKDTFYESLDVAVSGIPTTELVYILGDFNARVGANHEIWPLALGHHGVGKMNENGQRLLEFCSFHGLCVTNTFFQNKTCHKVSWRHPRSKHWHQLDLILTRRRSINNVCNTRAFHSADCDTDHSMIAAIVKLKPKKVYRSKRIGQPKIDTCQTAYRAKNDEFIERLNMAMQNEGEHEAHARWGSLKSTIYNAAIQTYGKKQHKNADWFEANITRMEPVIKAKRTALLNYKKDPDHQSLHRLRTARNDAQKTARRCANDYWLQLSQKIQQASDIGDVRTMYQYIKQATGKPTKKCAPLKSKSGSIIKNKNEQMDRWVEHYYDLYSHENIVSQEALNSLEVLPVMEELDMEPTMEELNRAIDALPSGKAPGADGIPPEVIKAGKSILLHPLHELLRLCWKEGQVPQEMRDSKIVTLYKNKGDRSDCNNYRGISLLSVVSKMFARVVLKRLQVLAERVYPESQSGFRARRSTVDMIFSIRQLQEKCREQQMPLYTAFIDLTKAFDLVSRQGLFQLLEKIGCPPRLLSIIASFHNDMRGSVSYDGEISEPFLIKSGVKQGCVLAPTLFGIFFSLLLRFAFRQSEEGIHLHTRSDGKLFNISRLRAKKNTRTILIRELLFADDAALVSHSETGLQELLSQLSAACREFGLTINVKKTNVMGQNIPVPPMVNINNEEVEVANNFTYLGANISCNLSLDAELDKRIAKAAAVMSKLKGKVWTNGHLSLNTKMAVYRACVLSTLLYGSESWTTYSGQENRLESFHLRCLRRILGVTWKDKVSNIAILERTGSTSLHLLLCQRRLRWLGHVHRMNDGRIPKDILYGELATGSRPLGRPTLRYKDVCKRDLKLTNISTTNWESLADDRNLWRQAVKGGIRIGEEKRKKEAAAKKKKRIERQQNPAPITTASTQHICSRCGKDCHARIGLLSHTRRCHQPNT